MSRSVKCSRDLRDFPPEAYRLSTDGRKWKRLCFDRRALAMELATFANGDGSSIKPGVARIMKNLSWSRAKVFRLLADLTELGLHKSTARSDGHKRLSSLRSLNLEALKSQIDSSKVSDSTSKVSDTPSKVSDSGVQSLTLRETQPTNTVHNNRPLPPTPGGRGGPVPETSSEEGQRQPPPSTTSSPTNDGQSRRPSTARDVVARLKRAFHATHGAYPWEPSKKKQVKQLVDLATTHGDAFWQAWDVFLSNGHCRPDTHSPWGTFIEGFDLWHRPAVRKPNTPPPPPWVTSKGAIQ